MAWGAVPTEGTEEVPSSGMKGCGALTWEGASGGLEALLLGTLVGIPSGRCFQNLHSPRCSLVPRVRGREKRRDTQKHEDPSPWTSLVF